MTKKVVPTLIISALLCLFMNGIIFSRVSILGARPDMMIALTVSVGILLGATRAQLICGAIGLLLDINSGRFIGLNCAIYVIAGFIAGQFFRKFYTDNIVFPAVVALVLSFLRENILAIFAMITGARFNYAIMMVAYMIPCAVFTAIMCIPLYLIQKPLLDQYGRYIYDKQSSLY